MRQLLYILFSVVLLSLFGCSGNNTVAPTNTGERGALTLSVAWPGSGSRTIPASATSIVVTVSQYGQTVGEMTIVKPETTGTLDNLPVGQVSVKGEAKDANGIVLAYNMVSATVHSGETSA